MQRYNIENCFQTQLPYFNTVLERDGNAYLGLYAGQPVVEVAEEEDVVKLICDVIH